MTKLRNRKPYANTGNPSGFPRGITTGFGRSVVLQFYLDTFERCGEPPSLDQVGQACNITRSTAFFHVKRLVRDGYLVPVHETGAKLTRSYWPSGRPRQLDLLAAWKLVVERARHGDGECAALVDEVAGR